MECQLQISAALKELEAQQTPTEPSEDYTTYLSDLAGRLSKEQRVQWRRGIPAH